MADPTIINVDDAPASSNLILDFHDGARAGILFLQNGALWRYDLAWESVDDDVRVFQVAVLPSEKSFSAAAKEAAGRLRARSLTRNTEPMTPQDEADLGEVSRWFSNETLAERKYAFCRDLASGPITVLSANDL